MVFEDDEIIREFLIESSENLHSLDSELVDLERHPTAETLASIFRTIHTIKGTCGFLGFQILEAITHQAESILSQLRTGQRPVSGGIVSLILESIDAVRQILSRIEATGQEGENRFPALLEKLKQAAGETSTGEGAACEAQQLRALNRALTTGTVAESSIRVDVKHLNKVMNLVGELVLARDEILQFTSQREDGGFAVASRHLDQIVTRLQESVMQARMQPIGIVWNKLRRVVRDVSQSLGKQLELKMEGAEIEIDKAIIEAIKDPLTHLVRNACDHGIEDPQSRISGGKPAKGTLRLKAFHEGGHVNIEISDDGAGINIERVKRKAIEKGLIGGNQAAGMTEREAIDLLFLPGFSTAHAITKVSGRGVGMDVVKSNVEKIGGAVDISTIAGRGTTVQLRIPFTFAMIPGLVVTGAGLA